jgi:hypothetical protein
MLYNMPSSQPFVQPVFSSRHRQLSMQWYEWVFSGIGGTLATGILFFVCRAVWQRLTKPRPEVIALNATEANDIDSAAIAKAMKGVAPLAEEHVAEQFIGLRINWEVGFITAHKIDKKAVNVVLSAKDFPQTNLGISIKTDVETYPFLKTLKDGDKLRVCGTIQRIKNNVVWLKKPSLALLQ